MAAVGDDTAMAAGAASAMHPRTAPEATTTTTSASSKKRRGKKGKRKAALTSSSASSASPYAQPMALAPDARAAPGRARSGSGKAPASRGHKGKGDHHDFGYRSPLAWVGKAARRMPAATPERAESSKDVIPALAASQRKALKEKKKRDDRERRAKALQEVKEKREAEKQERVRRQQALREAEVRELRRAKVAKQIQRQLRNEERSAVALAKAPPAASSGKKGKQSKHGSAAPLGTTSSAASPAKKKAKAKVEPGPSGLADQGATPPSQNKSFRSKVKQKLVSSVRRRSSATPGKQESGSTTSIGSSRRPGSAERRARRSSAKAKRSSLRSLDLSFDEDGEGGDEGEAAALTPGSGSKKRLKSGQKSSSRKGKLRLPFSSHSKKGQQDSPAQPDDAGDDVGMGAGTAGIGILPLDDMGLLFCPELDAEGPTQDELPSFEHPGDDDFVLDSQPSLLDLSLSRGGTSLLLAGDQGPGSPLARGDGSTAQDTATAAAPPKAVPTVPRPPPEAAVCLDESIVAPIFMDGPLSPEAAPQPGFLDALADEGVAQHSATDGSASPPPPPPTLSSHPSRVFLLDPATAPQPLLSYSPAGSRQTSDSALAVPAVDDQHVDAAADEPDASAEKSQEDTPTGTAAEAVESPEVVGEVEVEEVDAAADELVEDAIEDPQEVQEDVGQQQEEERQEDEAMDRDSRPTPPEQPATPSPTSATRPLRADSALAVLLGTIASLPPPPPPSDTAGTAAPAPSPAPDTVAAELREEEEAEEEEVDATSSSPEPASEPDAPTTPVGTPTEPDAKSELESAVVEPSPPSSPAPAPAPVDSSPERSTVVVLAGEAEERASSPLADAAAVHLRVEEEQAEVAAAEEVVETRGPAPSPTPKQPAAAPSQEAGTSSRQASPRPRPCQDEERADLQQPGDGATKGDARRPLRPMQQEQQKARPAAVAKQAQAPERPRDLPVPFMNLGRARNIRSMLRLCLETLGWGEWTPQVQGTFQLQWHGASYIDPAVYAELDDVRVNRFPKLNHLARKIALSRCLRRMETLFPEDFDFTPKTWFLPDELTEFTRHHQKSQRYYKGQDVPTRPVYIVKPDSGSQGDGIFLCYSPRELRSLHGRAVVQEYLQDPCLLDGLKFDLRLYVLVQSVNPPRYHVFREGLARFCTMPYQAPSARNMRQTFMHLTNYSLNKSSATYVHTLDAPPVAGDEEADVNPDVDQQARQAGPSSAEAPGADGKTDGMDRAPEGSKRTVSAVFKKLKEEQGQDPDELWVAIDKIVAKTMLSMNAVLQMHQETESPDTSSCFHFLGFDVILDKDCKPFLLEINANPSLRVDFEESEGHFIPSPIDEYIKLPMVTEGLQIVMGHKSPKQTALNGERKYQSLTDMVSNELSHLKLLEGCLKLFAHFIGRHRQSDSMRASAFRQFATRAGILSLHGIGRADLDILFRKALRSLALQRDALNFEGFCDVLISMALKAFPKDEPGTSLEKLLAHAEDNLAAS